MIATASNRSQRCWGSCHYNHYFFDQGKTSDGSKIRKENYKICLVVNPTLAGRHQRNHHAAKPN